MSTETPKQKLRRILDRLKNITPERVREIDRLIENLPDDEAETFVRSLDEMERESPGVLDEYIAEIEKNGIPDD